MVSAPVAVAILRAKLLAARDEKIRNKYQNDPVGWIEERTKSVMYGKTKEIAVSVVNNRRTAVPSAHDIGKPLATDTLLPTPSGWITMNDAIIGTQLYDENGYICNVINITDAELKPTYRITFNDSTYIDAADSHLWNVLDLTKRTKKSVYDWRNYWDDTNIKTTKELFDNVLTNNNQRRWGIPNNKSLQSVESWLFKWAPYTYGCWLGDGQTTAWNMTCHEDDAQHFALMTDSMYSTPKNRENIRVIHFPGQTYVDCPTIVLKVKEKFIPREMLRSSHEDRLELLRGIMDTDGYLTSGCNVEVDLSLELLSMSVVELIRSLGWIARWTTRTPRCNGKNGKLSYRITFTPNENPFHLPRKALLWTARQTSNMKSRTTKKTIISVEYLGVKEVKCVEVDSDRRLYLAGKGFIPTHNSHTAARLAMWWIDSHPPGQAFVVTTAPTAKQVKVVLWKEIRRAFVAAKMKGRLNQTELWLNNEMVALGRKPSDYDPTAFQGIHCLSNEHEILTKNGWKFQKDLEENDLVLSVDLNKNETNWMPITKIHRYDYKGNLNVYEDHRVSLAITNEHRLPVNVNNKWTLQKFTEIDDKASFQLRRTGTWIGSDFNIPEEFKEFNWTKEEFAFFIGYWIGDGGLRQHSATGRFYEVLLYRTKDFQIDNLLKKKLSNVKTYIGRDYIGFSNRKCAEWLFNNIGRYQPEREIPRFLLDADKSIINSLLDGLWFSDGTFKNNEHAGFYSCSVKLIDQIQELMIKLGRAGVVGINRLKETQNNSPQGIINVNHNTLTITWNKEEPNGYKLNKNAFYTEYYDDKVWCIETPYETFFTRRNGKVHLTGNSKYVLVIIDEGCGVDEVIFLAANSLIANEFGRILVIGNPDDPESHFAKICSPGSGWNVIPVSAFDTPNFTEEDVPQDVKDVLIGPIYVEEMKRDVGEDSGVYMSKVLGQFPVNKVDGVILLSWIMRCQSKTDEFEDDEVFNEYSDNVELGIDVGAGGDETSIREKRGKLAGRLWEKKTPEAEDALDIIVEAIERCRPWRIKIDSIGIGWALIALIKGLILRGSHYNEQLGREVDISFMNADNIVGVNVGMRATDPERFPRLRDQLWWEVGRGLSISGGWDLTYLDDVTIGQLIAPTWRPDLANRHKIESKQETMKRTYKPSPNRADALLLAFCEPPRENDEMLVVYEDDVVIGPDI